MRPWPLALSAAYLLGGLAVWISFVRTNHDGLANLGLVLYVFPVTVIGEGLSLMTGHTEFPLIPTRFGYLINHALFYFPSLLLIAGLIVWAAAALRRFL